MVKCYSLNARGLRDQQKRRQVFHFLKQKQFDVIFIQESHSTPEVEAEWKSEWNSEITFSHFTSRSRGVMTLYRKGIKPINHLMDKDGRLDVNEAEINDQIYTFINVYAPNIDNERILFFNELSANIFANWSINNLIMAGDFHVSLEKCDKKSKLQTVQRSADTVKQLMNEHSLIDIWREIHPTLKIHME